MNKTQQKSGGGRAEEWVAARLLKITTDPDYPTDKYLPDAEAVELACRCDEAEAERESLSRSFSNMHDEAMRVTELLAAAQSEAAALRVAWQNSMEREQMHIAHIERLTTKQP